MSNEESTAPLATYWQQQIQAWERSGQSQTAYCRSNELSYHRFGYWRRKILSLVDRPSNDRVSGFVPVTVHSRVATNDLSLTLPNGLVLQGITTDNLPLVDQLLARLS